MSDTPLMKDHLSEAAIERIANSFVLAWPDFPKEAFIEKGVEGVKSLELKERVHFLIARLHEVLPSDFKEAAAILYDVKNHWDYGRKEDRSAVFAAWPVIDYVAVYGLDDPEISLPLLAHLTSLFSSEFAIRPFFEKHYEATYAHCLQWRESEDYHVRRLASEGCRPRLPWGGQLKQFIEDPAPLFPILESLKDDSEDYVYRSVANNLNDISKDHPDKVIEYCKKWLADEPSTSCQWAVKHALRTLIKQGHPDVFGLLGYTDKPKVKVEGLHLTSKQLILGDTLELKFDLTSLVSQQQKVVIDYVLYFMKANGKHSPKVFKLKSQTITSKETISVEKSHPIKFATTRKYYAGEHRLAIMINGVELAHDTFNLEIP